MLEYMKFWIAKELSGVFLMMAIAAVVFAGICLFVLSAVAVDRCKKFFSRGDL